MVVSTLVAGSPVDERGVWHRNGPPFFLEVRHLSLDSAFQTLLHKLKATQCINVSLIQQYNQALFVGCWYLNCPVTEMDLTPNTTNPMIRNEISQRTFCYPLCRVTVPQMLLEGVHMECNLLPASHLCERKSWSEKERTCKTDAFYP